MPRSKKTQPTANTQTANTSVIDDFIHQNSSSEQDRADMREDLEVVAEHIDIANTSVSEVAVVKLAAESADVSSDVADVDANNAIDDGQLNQADANDIENNDDKLSNDNDNIDEATSELEAKVITQTQTDDVYDDIADISTDSADAIHAVDTARASGVDEADMTSQDDEACQQDETPQQSSLEQDSQENLSDPSNRSHDAKLSYVKQGIGGLFAKAGSYLTRDASKQYRRVDLTADSFAKHAFYVQGSSLGEGFARSIFGKKATTAQSLAHKFISEDKLAAISENIYHKVAELAHAWAIKSLKDDPKMLTSTQKDEMAQNLANENRLLATLGGVTGFFGLKGVVADTAWLLLVALRAVYQLAAVYDVPLTGKDGIKMAYGVLSGANLDKMQEKQLILTALALAGNVLTQAGESSLKEELMKLSSSNAALKDFDELLKSTHLDKLTDKYGIDIDKLNSSWLRRLTSLSAVGVGAYYNRDLIDEVIGTATATFKEITITGIEYQSDV